MKIELRKVSHENKGAELMLRAMVAHCAGRPGVELTGRLQVGPRERRAALDIQTLLYASRGAWFATTPRLLPPRAVRDRLGLVHPADLDVVLDASGFAYGDQWGPDRALQAASYFHYVRRHGAKVVLMPQSFGPFEKAKVRRAAKKLLGEVDLVFPRDATAMRCVEELNGPSERIIQSPDFTPLVHGEVPADLDLSDKAAAVIPNLKMVEMTGVRPGAYESFVADVIEVFFEHGLRPFFLLHATQDVDLVERIRLRVARFVPVVRESDALRLKGIISKCHVAMCSRFHGLVNSLCQAVPVVATGWSHKYKHLLEEYHCPEALFDVRDDRDILKDRVAEMLTPKRHAQLRRKLRLRAEWHREQVVSMWDRVDALVG